MLKLKQLFSKIAIAISALAFCITTLNSFSQGTWTQKASFGGIQRWGAVGFSIGTKGYIGTGSPDGTISYKDFWEWDQTTNTWTQKADFGGTTRYDATGFSIGTKGYIGTGYFYSNDFWEWDQTTNSWTKKTNFGGSVRYGAVGFSIGTKGYIGTGRGVSHYQDFWEWDQATDLWTQKADFGGVGRAVAASFAIGAKGYIGTGCDGGWPVCAIQDFWEWDQASNTWTQKADFGGPPTFEATGFSIDCYGYIGIGQIGPGTTTCVSDFWRYDPVTNVWLQMANFGGGPREMAVGFSIGGKGYIGTGLLNDIIGSQKNDFWEYIPNPCSNILSAIVSQSNPLCNNQCTGTATVTPTSGTGPYTYSWNTIPVQTTQIATGLCSGTYSVLVANGFGSTGTAAVIITQPAAMTVSVTVTSPACGGINGEATAAAAGGNGSYSYSWSNGQTAAAATGLSAGTYSVTITDINGCMHAQTVIVVGSITTSQSAGICLGSTYTLPSGAVVSTGGTYTDTLTFMSGCDSIITTTLTVHPNPIAAAFANITITEGQSVTLTASGGGIYSWNNGASGSSITVSPPLTTLYCITVTDANNCTDTACVMVTIEPIDCSSVGELYLPNAFSPNGDGENDILQIHYGNIKCIKTFELAIYNRWGEEVFKTADPGFQWRGTKNKDMLMNTSVYIYYLNVTLISGEAITKKGNVSLIK